MDTSVQFTQNSSRYFEKNAEIDQKDLSKCIEALIQFVKVKGSCLSSINLQKEEGLDGRFCLTLNYKISEIHQSPIGSLLNELSEKVKALSTSPESIFVQFEKGCSFTPNWPIDLSEQSTIISWSNTGPWLSYLHEETSYSMTKLGHFYKGAGTFHLCKMESENGKIEQDKYRLFIQFSSRRIDV